jgi:hypothetical protein
MSAKEGRAAASRRGGERKRGAVILRFEPLEGRTLLSGATTDVVNPIEILSTTTSGPAASEVAETDSTTTTDEAVAAVALMATTDDSTATTTTTATDTTVTDDSLAYATTVVDDSAPTDTTTTTTTDPSDGEVTIAVPPDLALTAFDTLHNLDWGQTFRAAGKIRNDGAGTAPAGTEIDVYASTTTALNAGSVYVGTVKITQPIAPGQEVSFNQPMDAPPSRIDGMPANNVYYMVPVVDPGNKVVEVNEANNGGTGETNPTSLVTVVTLAEPRVVGSQFSLTPLNASSASWGGTLQVVATLTNATANTTAAATRARIVLAPQGQSPDSGSAVTIGEFQVPALAGGGSATVRGTVYLKTTPPATLAGKTAYTAYLVADSDFQYRPAQSATAVQGVGLDSQVIAIATPKASTTTPVAQVKRADLSVESVTPAASTAAWSQSIQVQTVVKNSGTADSGPMRVRFVLANANRPNDNSLALADAVIENLAAGSSTTITQILPLTGKLPDGLSPEDIAGRIVVLADPENTVDESNEGNNGRASGALILKMPTREDVVKAPTNATPASSAPTSTSTTTPTTTTTTTTPTTTSTTTSTTTTTSPTTTTTTTPTTTKTTRTPLKVYPRARASASTAAAQQKQRQIVRQQQQLAARAARLAAQKTTKLRVFPRTAGSGGTVTNRV